MQPFRVLGHTLLRLGGELLRLRHIRAKQRLQQPLRLGRHAHHAIMAIELLEQKPFQLGVEGLHLRRVIGEIVGQAAQIVQRLHALRRDHLRPFVSIETIVQTERTREYAAARWKALLVVIPNPVLRPRSGDVPPEPLVVGIGRLVPQKGFDVLVRAFADAAPRLPGWQLLIAGEGPERQSLQSLAHELGVADRVALPGVVRDNDGLLRRASIFVLASRFEGFPNALAEAMASGRAVVATDCPTGPRELTRDGTAGLLVPVDNVAAMSGALQRLGHDGELRRRLGEAAVAAVAPYDVGEVLEKWQELFRRVTSITTPRPTR